MWDSENQHRQSSSILVAYQSAQPKLRVSHKLMTTKEKLIQEEKKLVDAFTTVDPLLHEDRKIYIDQAIKVRTLINLIPETKP